MTGAEEQRAEILERLRKLADRRANDAVKLAFLTEGSADRVDELDLSGLVEMKRSEKGFEAKFVDQLKVLEMMRELTQKDTAKEAEAFFQALNSSAGAGTE